MNASLFSLLMIRTRRTDDSDTWMETAWKNLVIRFCHTETNWHMSI